MTRKPLIEICDVNFSYSGLPILKNVNLRFQKGGFYLIIGPNGGGKTTLLSLILGLKAPTTGAIFIDGKPPSQYRSKIGYVPQSFSFDPLFPISVFEFVLMGSLSQLKWHGIWDAKVKEKAIELLLDFDILSFKDQQIGQLSGGERQRASLARALMNDPEILILDEPTNGLDVIASNFIQEKLIELKGQKTILMVSHMISDVVDAVDDITSVQCETEKISKATVCSHYKLGLYHRKERL